MTVEKQSCSGTQVGFAQFEERPGSKIHASVAFEDNHFAMIDEAADLHVPAILLSRKMLFL